MYILVILYIVWPVLQVWFYLNPAYSLVTADLLPPPAELVNYITSILCANWMVANVLLALRLPWLQSRLPHDYKIRFHIIFTLGIALSFLYHTLYKIIAGRLIGLEAWILLGIFLLMVFFAVSWVDVPGFVHFRHKVTGKIKILFSNHIW